MLRPLGATSLVASGEDRLAALTAGYHAAFLVGALFAAGAALLSAALLRESGVPAAATDGEADDEPEPVAEAA